MVKINKITALFLISVLSFSLVSCGKKAPVDTGKQNQNALKGSITVLTDNNDLTAVNLTTLNFKKEYPNVEIKIKNGSNVEETFNSLSYEDMSDILVMEDENCQHFISKYKYKLQETSELIGSYKDNLLKSRSANIAAGGKMYGLSWYTSPMAVYYRSDLFTSMEINPMDIKTWGDYYDIWESKLKAPNKKMFAFMGGNQYKLYEMMTNQLRNNYFDKEGKPNFTSDKSCMAANFISKIYNSGMVYDSDSYNSIISSLKSGGTVCLLADSSVINILQKEMPELKDKWGIMPLPAFEPGGNRYVLGRGANFMLRSESKSKEIAAKFIEFAIKDRSNSTELMKKCGLIPSYTDQYNMKIFSNPIEYFNNQPIWNQFADTARLANERYYAEKYPDVRDMVNASLVTIVKSKQDAKVVFETLEKEIEEKIK